MNWTGITIKQSDVVPFCVLWERTGTREAGFIWKLWAPRKPSCLFCISYLFQGLSTPPFAWPLSPRKTRSLALHRNKGQLAFLQIAVCSDLSPKSMFLGGNHRTNAKTFAPMPRKCRMSRNPIGPMLSRHGPNRSVEEPLIGLAWGNLRAWLLDQTKGLSWPQS